MKCMTFVLIVFLFGVAGCADKNDQGKGLTYINAPYAPGAISINIQSTPGLNSWRNVANSCTTLVIQSERIDLLNEVLSDPIRLEKIFQGMGTDEAILKTDRYVALPGQQTTLHIDRSADTRVVAIVAGYYPFPQSHHIRTVTIPWEISYGGWFRKKPFAELTQLDLNMILGEQSIIKFKRQGNFSDDLLHPGGKIINANELKTHLVEKK